ncbi:NADH-quinone oxidoreductase subunit J family protein [Sulfurovum sp. NBC37-1]|uniref:NADH-quinone oxidoreductase subunit J family protein n=1 Tax=Sulfurovum sp. (strain NBC37-1) TaxID=387093 RepID=UPI0001587560|nr:NADH-quinone oxidoreductase subunit J [Sulfurovum sp. NBC37-1]BAF71807.1 NADH-quinone oxidoreductase, chain J [Sulfurovum sp. NBC37-1]
MSLLLLTVVLILAAASLMIKKSVPAMISFALMMFLLGIYYVTLDAKLLGLFQIFVYAGGIVVLMLFGVTIIGVEFPKAASRPWAAVSAFLVFVLLTVLFFRAVDTLKKVAGQPTEKVDLFAHSFSDMVILFALIGASLLYGTIKMTGQLKSKRSKDV